MCATVHSTHRDNLVCLSGAPPLAPARRRHVVSVCVSADLRKILRGVVQFKRQRRDHRGAVDAKAFGLRMGLAPPLLTVCGERLCGLGRRPSH